MLLLPVFNKVEVMYIRRLSFLSSKVVFEGIGLKLIWLRYSVVVQFRMS